MCFQKYVAVHRKRVRNETESFATMVSLESCLGQAVDEMEGDGMEDF